MFLIGRFYRKAGLGRLGLIAEISPNFTPTLKGMTQCHFIGKLQA